MKDPFLPLALLLGLIISTSQAGFSRPDQVRSYHEIAPASEKLPAISAQSHAAPYEAIKWDDPEGWTSLPATGMRLGGFQVGSSQCSIISLSGQAGGMEANVKRWLDQVGLGGMEESKFKAFMEGITEVQTDGNIAFKLVDITRISTGAISTIAGVATLPDKTLFVKLTGPAEGLEELRKPFMELLKSFHYTQAANASTAQALPFSQPDTKEKTQALIWKTPSKWKETPGAGMRVASFRDASGDSIECYITILGGDGGGLERNAQWWANQLGQSLEGDALVTFIDQQEQLSINGAPFHVFDYGSLISDKNANSMMVAVGTLSSKTVFVKMTGTKKDTQSHRKSFMSLVKSLKQP